MHLLVIFLQYLLGKFLNKPQPQPVPIPERTPSAQAELGRNARSDRQAFESTNGPPGSSSTIYGSTETGTDVPGLDRLGRYTILSVVALLSAACLGLDHPEISSHLPTLRPCLFGTCAAVGHFSPEMRA